MPSRDDARPRSSQGRLTRRHVLIASTALAATAVVAGGFYALFGPLYSGTETMVGPGGVITTRDGTESLWEHGVHPLGWAALGIFAACGAGLAMAAIGLALRAPWEPVFGLICVSAPVLLGMSWIAGFTIGFFFFPGAILALVAMGLVIAHPERPQ